MKYIKTYEKLNTLEIDDYVILNSDKYNKILDDFLKNNIGKIVNIRRNSPLYNTSSKFNSYMIQFNEPNPWDYSKYLATSIDNIEYWSPNKEDCEAFLLTKNYNI